MEIRRFCSGGEEVLSGLMRRTLLEVNAVDCLATAIDFLYNKYTPAGVLDLAGRGSNADGLIEMKKRPGKM